MLTIYTSLEPNDRPPFFWGVLSVDLSFYGAPNLPKYGAPFGFTVGHSSIRSFPNSCEKKNKNGANLSQKAMLQMLDELPSTRLIQANPPSTTVIKGPLLFAVGDDFLTNAINTKVF